MPASLNPDPSAASLTNVVHPAAVELVLTGMHCVSCAELIRETLEAKPGVGLAVVDLDSSTARVSFDPSAVTVDDLCALVGETGYGASPREDATAS